MCILYGFDITARVILTGSDTEQKYFATIPQNANPLQCISAFVF